MISLLFNKDILIGIFIVGVMYFFKFIFFILENIDIF